jgi:hypothetical protein
VKRRRQSLQSVRYAYDEVLSEVVRVVKRMPRGTGSALAAAANLRPSEMSHRLAGRVRFPVEELGAIADALHGPPGWPFIQWHQGDAV